MKKVTLLISFLLLGVCVSGVYAYSEGMLDDIVGEDDQTDDNETPAETSGTPPIARITPSNPKIQINETISFSGTDSTDSDGDDLSFMWSFEGDSKNYEGPNIDRNYPDKGEFLVKLIVTDSTGLSDEIETTVLVVEDYSETHEGDVDDNPNTDDNDAEDIEIPVDKGFISLRIEYTLTDTKQIWEQDESTVTLRLTDADGVVVDEEIGVGAGDGVWSYNSDELSSNGEYVFTIEIETGSMNYNLTVDVTY